MADDQLIPLVLTTDQADGYVVITDGKGSVTVIDSGRSRPPGMEITTYNPDTELHLTGYNPYMPVTVTNSGHVHRERPSDFTFRNNQTILLAAAGALQPR